jgi:hypothetical protein
MLTRFSNNFYRLEQPSDIELVKKDMEEKDSIQVIYEGEQVYPFYALCNNEYMGCDYLVVHIEG